jgi:hypothetical protein
MAVPKQKLRVVCTLAKHYGITKAEEFDVQIDE